MKILLSSFLCIILTHFSIFSQTDRLGKTVSFSARSFNTSKTNFVQSNGLGETIIMSPIESIVNYVIVKRLLKKLSMQCGLRKEFICYFKLERRY